MELLQGVAPRACVAGLLPALAILARAGGDRAHELDYGAIEAGAVDTLWWEQHYLREAHAEHSAMPREYRLARVRGAVRFVETKTRTPGPALTLDEQHELFFVKSLAVETMRWISTSGTNASEAKRIQLEVSGRLPLAVCFGERVLYPVVAGKVRRHVPDGLRSGCGRIFYDNRSVAGRKLFKTYCGGCGGGKRHPLREAAAAVRARDRTTVR